MSARLPHKNVPMPPEYAEMMREYITGLPLAAIREAWKHHATPTEVRRSMDANVPATKRAKEK